MVSRRARQQCCTRVRASLAAAGSPKPRRRARASWMSPPLSAGILLFRQQDGELQVLLIKPGGPFWRGKNAGAWMIPKGLVEPGEAPAEAALREFAEEIGTVLSA